MSQLETTSGTSPVRLIIQGRLLEELTNIRVNQPQRLSAALHQRKRRQRLTNDGRLNIIACDHPARRVVAAAGDELAMSDRAELLIRISEILWQGTADGVMASLDILQELALINELLGEESAFLGDKLMIVSLNRGGLAHTSWELDDPMVGINASQVAVAGLDGMKLLLRICDRDDRSLNTLRYCAQAISAGSQEKLPIFLEPLQVQAKAEGGYAVCSKASQQAKVVGVASALGNSSAYLWLKLPYCEEFPLVAKATTLPILLLGGEEAEPAQFAAQLKDTMRSCHNVRGAMIGRGLLFPPSAHYLEAARVINDVVHSA